MIDRDQGAQKLATVVRAFWKARGHEPKVWVEQREVNVSATDIRLVFVVRSNMVGGWPMAGPRHHLKMAPDSKSDSPSRFVGLAGVTQRQTPIESVRASEGLWREEAGAHV